MTRIWHNGWSPQKVVEADQNNDRLRSRYPPPSPVSYNSSIHRNRPMEGTAAWRYPRDLNITGADIYRQAFLTRRESPGNGVLTQEAFMASAQYIFASKMEELGRAWQQLEAEPGLMSEEARNWQSTVVTTETLAAERRYLEERRSIHARMIIRTRRRQISFPDDRLDGNRYISYEWTGDADHPWSRYGTEAGYNGKGGWAVKRVIAVNRNDRLVEWSGLNPDSGRPWSCSWRDESEVPEQILKDWHEDKVIDDVPVMGFPQGNVINPGIVHEDEDSYVLQYGQQTVRFGLEHCGCYVGKIDVPQQMIEEWEAERQERGVKRDDGNDRPTSGDIEEIDPYDQDVGNASDSSLSSILSDLSLPSPLRSATSKRKADNALDQAPRKKPRTQRAVARDKHNMVVTVGENTAQADRLRPKNGRPSYKEPPNIDKT